MQTVIMTVVIAIYGPETCDSPTAVPFLQYME